MSVTLTNNDGVVLIQIDDGKANAASHALLEGLENALDSAEADDIAKAVVLAGRDRVFSAGFDLDVVNSGDAARIGELVSRGGRMVRRLYSYPKPVVAAVTGHSVALGALWTLACDMRIGAEGDFKVGLNETAIGMDLPTFGMEVSRMRLEPRYLTEAILGAKIYNPAEAVTVGFLDATAPMEKVVDVAIERARGLGAYPGAAYASNKARLRGHSLAVIDAALEKSPFA